MFERAAREFGGLRPLSAGGEFELHVETEPPSRPRVVLMAHANADSERARERLAAVAEAHDVPPDSAFAPLHSAGLFEGRPYVAFVSPAVCDLAHVLERIRESGTRIRYAQGIVFIDLLLRALAAAHRAGRTFGALSSSNVLVEPDGRLRVVGLGDNVLALSASGRPIQSANVHAAPEVAAGAEPSRGGDLYAITLLCRRLLPYVDFPDPVERVLQGRPEPEDYELAQLFLWCNLSVLASFPDRRPSLELALEKEHRAWRLARVDPDPVGFAELLRRHALPPGPELTVDATITVVSVNGQRAELGTRRALRRIVSALIERHRAAPGQILSGPELVAAGWPDEAVLPEAAANRLYVALSSLRKLGLGAVIERCDGGWRLGPATVVRVVGGRAPAA